MEKPTHVTFLLISGFMMAAFVLALDALRLANWRSGHRHFTWDVRTSDDKPAEANNGMIVNPDVGLREEPAPQAVFVAAGFSPERGFNSDVFAWLRALNHKNAVLGGWDTGPLALAEAGLMDNHRMAVHWQVAPAVADRYPRIDIDSVDHVIDRRRFTAPGGVTTFNLLLEFIAQATHANVSAMVADSANHESPGMNDQAGAAKWRLGRPLGPKVQRAVSLMQHNLEEPIGIPEIADRSGYSMRTFYRAFESQVGIPPKQYYLSLRIERAKELLRQTEFPIAEIAQMTGFSSSSVFAQAFRRYCGTTPTGIRRLPRWLNLERSAVPTTPLVRTDP